MIFMNKSFVKSYVIGSFIGMQLSLFLILYSLFIDNFINFTIGFFFFTLFVLILFFQFEESLTYHRKVIFTILIILFLTFIISFNMIDGFLYRGINSGFFFDTRLPEILSLENSNQQNFNVSDFDPFPFSPSLLLTISKITNTPIFDVIYIPILNSIPFLFYFILTRRIFKSNLLPLLLSSSVFFYNWATVSHHLEYQTGEMLLPLFFFALFLYVKTNDTRYYLSSLLLLLPIKFFAPHVEVIAISFLVIFSIIILIKEFKIKKLVHIGQNLPINILLFSLIIFFAWNPKFYQGLLQGNLNINILLNFHEFFYQLIYPNQSIILEYGATPRSPILLLFINSFFVLLTLILIFIPLLLLLLKNLKKIDIFINDFSKEDVFILSLILCFIPDFLVLASIGAISTKKFTLFGPIVAIYITKNYSLTPLVNYFHLNKKKIINVLVVIFFVLSILSNVGFHLYDFRTPVGNDESNILLSEYISSNSLQKSYLLTDFDTYGIIKTYLARSNKSYNTVVLSQYTDEKYSYVIGKNNESISEKINFFILNQNFKNRALHRGPPDWRYFKSISGYIYAIEQNNNLNKVSTINNYIIYT